MENQQLQLTETEQRAAIITKGPRNIGDLLKSDEFKAAVKMALPKHLTADRFVRVAINATMRTPKLLQCTKESLFRCLLDLSAYGLEADGRRAHLIPFGQECQLIIDYKGLVELVRRSGEVSYIHADVVYEGDEFAFSYGSDAKVIHRPNLEKRGTGQQKRLAFYSFVKLKDGCEDFMVMSPAEIDAVRRRSRAASVGPWMTDYDEMGKKTVFRRHSKWLPLSSESRDAIERDDDFAGIDVGAFAEEVEPLKPTPIDLKTVGKAADQQRPEDLGQHTGPAPEPQPLDNSPEALERRKREAEQLREELAKRAARKCGVCNGSGHDARNCPQKTQQASSAPTYRVQVREVDSLDNEDPKGLAPALKCKGKYYMPTSDGAAWHQVPQQLAEEAVQ